MLFYSVETFIAIKNVIFDIHNFIVGPTKVANITFIENYLIKISVKTWVQALVQFSTIRILNNTVDCEKNPSLLINYSDYVYENNHCSESQVCTDANHKYATDMSDF